MSAKLSILIIEDEKNICDFIAAALMNQDYRVFKSYSGMDGLSQITSRCPDILLLDLGLPDMDGTDIIREVRKWSAMPVIVISARTLENEKVLALDLGEVGDMISGLVTELKSFDVEEEEKGFLGFFKKSGNKMTALKAKYDKAEVNVEKICDVLEGHQRQLMKDVAVLDKMYEINLSYFKELSMYILAGKKRLAEVRATELAQASAKAKASDLPEDAQAAKDLEEMCNRFEKKIHDLELTRMIAIQTAPQIRLVQSSNTVMIEKIQSTVVNTIPLWKSQMVIALGVEHANQAARAQREVTDMTNELLRKNAAALKTATVEAAKESERGIVDLDTLKTTNQALISTFDEVMKIQEDGRAKRREAEGELARMELELKNKLLEIRG